MPTFEIGLEDGRKLHIEADSHEAALSGVQHFLKQDADSNTALGAVQRGTADTVRSLGQTVDVLTGSKGTGEGVAARLDDPNYKATSPTEALQNQGLGAGAESAAKGAAQMLPGMALPLAAARLLKGRFALPAALGTAAAEYFGPNVNARAKAEGHETPSWGDLGTGAATTAAQTALAAAPLGRLMPGANPIASLGAKGIVDSAKKLGLTAATEAAANAGQSAVGQAGATVGTPGGLQVDPKQTADAALTGGLAGAMAGAPRGVADASTAVKYRDFGGDNAGASAALATRLQDASTGNLSNPKRGKEALDAAQGDVHRELRDAVADVQTRQTLSPDIDNALSRASQGGKVNPQELGAVTKAIGSDPQAANVEHLIRQAQMAQQLRNSGYTVNGKLVGGLSGAMSAGIHAIKSPGQVIAGATIAGLGLGHGLPGFVGMYAPATVLPLFGAYGAALGAGKLTGSRSPVNRFVNRFADPAAQVRLAPQNAPQAGAGSSTSAPASPQGPWGPRGPGPTGPQVPPQAPPAGPAPPPVPTDLLRAAVPPPPASMMPPAPANPLLQQRLAAAALRAQMSDAKEQMAARKANDQLASPAPLAKDAMALMASRAGNQKLAEALAKAQGQRAADREARNSPAVPDFGIASQPGFGQRASQLLSAQKALDRLRAEPEEAQAPSAPVEPKATKVSKANGKTTHTVEQPPMADALGVAPFMPKEPHELPYYGQEHADVAEQKLANRPDYQNLPKARKEVIKEGIIRGRMTDESKVLKFADELPSFDDKQHILDLAEELHHTSSRQRAREARDHYASLLPPAVAAKVKAELSDAYINKSKRKD